MDALRGEKRDIHVSICHSERFHESMRRADEAKLIVEKRAREHYVTV